jgi:hypothetical protein
VIYNEIKKLMNWQGEVQDLVYLYQLPLFGKIKNGQSQHNHVIGLKFPVAGNQNIGLPPLN